MALARNSLLMSKLLLKELPCMGSYFSICLRIYRISVYVYIIYLFTYISYICLRIYRISVYIYIIYLFTYISYICLRIYRISVYIYIVYLFTYISYFISCTLKYQIFTPLLVFEFFQPSPEFILTPQLLRSGFHT